MKQINVDTFSLQVPQLLFSISQRVVPGDHRTFRGFCCFHCSQWSPGFDQHTLLVQPGQWHGLKHTLMEQPLHFRPGHNICTSQKQQAILF